MKRDIAALLAALEGAFSHTETEDRCAGCGHAVKKDGAKPAEPVNRNVARLERCGGEVMKPGQYRLICDEPMAVISVADLDKFVSECAKIDKV
jgi:hypothetical protein